MLSLAIANATRVLAKDQEEYHRLHILDEKCPQTGVHRMISLWQPSPKELRQLMEGGSVRLSIEGTIHPPVAITTQPLTFAEEAEDASP